MCSWQKLDCRSEKSAQMMIRMHSKTCKGSTASTDNSKPRQGKGADNMKNKNKIKQVTASEVEHWIGSDTTREQIFDIIAEIANGRYEPSLLNQEIRDCE
jgi:hypothetical protein